MDKQEILEQLVTENTSLFNEVLTNRAYFKSATWFLCSSVDLIACSARDLKDTMYFIPRVKETILALKDFIQEEEDFYRSEGHLLELGAFYKILGLLEKLVVVMEEEE